MVSKKRLLGGRLLVKDFKDFLVNSYMQNHKENIGKFIYDPLLSDNEVQVYYSPKQIVVVHRGSATLKDFFTDYKLLKNSNFKNSRVRKSINVIDKVIEKYPGRMITSIGHSLAGFLASLTDKVFESIGLNSYIPPGEAGKTIPDNEFLVRSQLDVPSVLEKTQKRNPNGVITIPASTSNLLTEHSYEILNRLNQDAYIGREPSL